jgi:elongator complex protein 1
VQIIPSALSVVLQMPRGNLETIYPRALVLAGVRRNIEKLDYKSAFLACRQHRVDMNIIYDHMPTQFLEHVPEIIKQLGKAEYIDLFVSQLK